MAAVVAVGAAGVFAVANFSGSTAGGSDDPADLGTELLNAIEGEDLLGIIDVLVPGEREALGEPFVELVTELQRLEILAETDLSDIAGLDIELTDEVVRTRTTNVDDIVNISLSADVTVSIDGAELPIGDLLSDNMPDDMLADVRGTQVTENDQLDITLTGVREDGRWYFSLLHTVAELAREELAGDVGIPLEGVGFDGADSPQAAVDQMLDRIEALDLAGIIRTLDPSEAAALQRYAPLFLDDAQAELDDASFSWEITERSVRIEGSGDQRTAFVDALAIEGSFDGGSFSFSVEGECVVAEMDGQRFEQCGDVGSISDVEDVFGDDPEVLHLIEVVQEAFSDVEPIGLELRSRNGEWFVSPIASSTDAMLKVLRALDRQELDDIIDAAEPAIESIVDGFFGVSEDFSSSDFDLAVPVDPGSAIDQPGDQPDVPELGWLDCYEFDVDEATECFQSYVATGEITDAEVPVVLRHPECGYADVGWGGALYGLSDEEFTARAEAARAMFPRPGRRGPDRSVGAARRDRLPRMLRGPQLVPGVRRPRVRPTFRRLPQRCRRRVTAVRRSTGRPTGGLRRGRR